MPTRRRCVVYQFDQRPTVNTTHTVLKYDPSLSMCAACTQHDMPWNQPSETGSGRTSTQNHFESFFMLTEHVPKNVRFFRRFTCTPPALPSPSSSAYGVVDTHTRIGCRLIIFNGKMNNEATYARRSGAVWRCGHCAWPGWLQLSKGSLLSSLYPPWWWCVRVCSE